MKEFLINMLILLKALIFGPFKILRDADIGPISEVKQILEVIALIPGTIILFRGFLKKHRIID